MPTWGRLRPDRLDLYTLRHLAGPFALALATLLLAQMLERLLRLFDLVASTGAALSAVARMAAYLLPHYLGLALPTAFTAGIFMAIARVGDDNELDVMLATGRSIARIAAPYFALALLLCLFNLYLLGQLQPHSRYRYHVAVHEAQQAGWNARVEDNRFLTVGHGLTLSAARVAADGRQLHEVFVSRQSDGRLETTTAREGVLLPMADGRLLLELRDGQIVDEQADGQVSQLRFARAVLNEDFTPAPPPFRPRGASVRELTLAELWAGLRGEEVGLPLRKLSGEFHGRLARTMILPLLPLLALPLGMAAKRGRRAPGIVFAALALLALNHSLQFGESLAESGRASTLLAVWSPAAIFALLGVWLFRASLRWPGDNPVMRAVDATEQAFEGIGRLARRGKAA